MAALALDAAYSPAALAAGRRLRGAVRRCSSRSRRSSPARFGRPLRRPRRARSTRRRCCCSSSPASPRSSRRLPSPWLPLRRAARAARGDRVRAAATGSGALYFVAAFFAIAAQAVVVGDLSRRRRLRAAVALYAAFGVVRSSAAPIVARRAGRRVPAGVGRRRGPARQPACCSSSPRARSAPAALWALALLLAILNAGDVHRERGRRPAADLVCRIAALVGGARDLVDARRRQRRHAAVAAR